MMLTITYLKRVKQVGESQARADVEGMYGGQNTGINIKNVPELSKGLQLAFTAEEFNAVTEIAKQGFGNLGKDGLAEFRRTALKQNDANFDELNP